MNLTRSKLALLPIYLLASCAAQRPFAPLVAFEAALRQEPRSSPRMYARSEVVMEDFPVMVPYAKTATDVDLRSGISAVRALLEVASQVRADVVLVEAPLPWTRATNLGRTIEQSWDLMPAVAYRVTPGRVGIRTDDRSMVMSIDNPSARTAGLLEGDKIVAVNGIKAGDEASHEAMILWQLGARPGEFVTIQWERRGAGPMEGEIEIMSNDSPYPDEVDLLQRAQEEVAHARRRRSSGFAATGAGDSESHRGKGAASAPSSPYSFREERLLLRRLPELKSIKWAPSSVVPLAVFEEVLDRAAWTPGADPKVFSASEVNREAFPALVPYAAMTVVSNEGSQDRTLQELARRGAWVAGDVVVVTDSVAAKEIPSRFWHGPYGYRDWSHYTRAFVFREAPGDVGILVDGRNTVHTIRNESARAAGLAEGDTLLSVEGMEWSYSGEAKDLNSWLLSAVPGDPMELVWIRPGVGVLTGTARVMHNLRSYAGQKDLIELMEERAQKRPGRELMGF